MIKLTKLRNGNIILDINNASLKLNFSENKIWLTKGEIGRVFGIRKTDVRNILSDIRSNSASDYDSNINRILNISLKKEKTYYSIDLIILLGYRLNDFSSTKTLIKINRTMKNLGINRRGILNKLKNKLENFSIESFFTKKYIISLSK